MIITIPMKKTLTLKNIAFALFLTLPVLTNAQAPKTFGKSITEVPNPENGMIRCISSEYESYLQANNSNRATTDQFESWISGKIAERRATSDLQKSGNTVVTLPVVIHVIHNGDALGSNENIKEGQILAQLESLNNDFRRKPGTAGYNDMAVGADTEIQFCLAQVDPSGEPTSGIIRYNKQKTFWTRQEVEDQLKFQTQWDPEKYLNIWVANFGGDLSNVLGYAQFPSDSGLPGLDGGLDYTDGVIINYKNFGNADIFPGGTYGPPYNKGRTSSHEIGHFLGLRHIWGDGAGCNNTDYCDDTPFAYEANSSCLDDTLDSCPSKPGLDMTNNYMDYTNDDCMNVFTQDQKERMVTVLANATRRKTLVTSTVCGLATSADFEMLRGMTVYPNPAQNELNISVGNSEMPDSYVIYNTLGQTVANVKVSGESSLTVNTSEYAKGVYIIKIFKGNDSKTIKFIKE